MIGMITGSLLHITINEVIVDVNGIGYEIAIPLSTYDKLPKTGEQITLFTHTYVREDEISLFGFFTKEEKSLYRMLMLVSGIGPKLALKVLSSISVFSFVEAVSNSDLKILTKINGLGKKTAERLVIELKDKISTISPEAAFGKAPKNESISKSVEEAVLALLQLGFKYDVARKAVGKVSAEIPENEQSSENLIRLTLHLLNN